MIINMDWHDAMICLIKKPPAKKQGALLTNPSKKI